MDPKVFVADQENPRFTSKVISHPTLQDDSGLVLERDGKLLSRGFDLLGHVYELNSRIFRGITREYEDEILELFHSDLIQDLVQQGVFPITKISKIKTNRYSLVLEHERSHIISTPKEWSFEMIKDAINLTFEVNKIANEHGYHLKDANLSNVVFFNAKPKFVDLGSFLENAHSLDSSGNIQKQMLYRYIYPLRAWAKGHSVVAQSIFSTKLSHNASNNLSQESIPLLLHPILNLIIGKKVLILGANVIHFKNRIFNKLNKKFLGENFFYYKHYRKIVNKLKNPHPVKKIYNELLTLGVKKATPTSTSIIEIVRTLKPKSILTVDANICKNSLFLLTRLLLKEKLAKVAIYAATEYQSVDSVYRTIQQTNEPITPVLFKINNHRYDLKKYLKSDLLLGPNLTTSSTRKKNHVPLLQSFGSLHSICKKHLIIQYIKRKDVFYKSHYRELYSLRVYKESLEHYFEIIQEVKIDENSIIFLAKPKTQELQKTLN